MKQKYNSIYCNDCKINNNKKTIKISSRQKFAFDIPKLVFIIITFLYKNKNILYNI